MTKVYISGIGMTKFGEIWTKSLRDLATEASLSAINNAGLITQDIDAVYVANMIASKTAGQSHLGALITSALGINVPAMRIEGACASGGLAIIAASDSIKSGKYKRVLVVGAEKMTDISSSGLTSALMEAADEEWEGFYGATFAGLYALIARAYMKEFGLTEKDMALVAVKNHRNSSLNPNAHFRQEISLNDVMKSAPVATPLKMLDCAPISDGSAAVVMTDESAVNKSKGMVELIGSGCATDGLSLASRDSLTTFKSAKIASINAYSEAGITPRDIDFAEVHDCFTIAEIIAMEDLGFYGKGNAVSGIRKGETNLKGKLPINTSGGLKGCGHPVGATGVKQVVEVVTQLRSEAGKRQVKNAKIGLTHNIGGSGATCCVNIFRKEK